MGQVIVNVHADKSKTDIKWKGTSIIITQFVVANCVTIMLFHERLLKFFFLQFRIIKKGATSTLDDKQFVSFAVESIDICLFHYALAPLCMFDALWYNYIMKRQYTYLYPLAMIISSSVEIVWMPFLFECLIMNQESVCDG